MQLLVLNLQARDLSLQLVHHVITGRSARRGCRIIHGVSAQQKIEVNSCVKNTKIERCDNEEGKTPLQLSLLPDVMF